MANTFEAEVARSGLVLGLHYQRLPIPPRSGNVILKKNPYDAYLVEHGQFHALELKSLAQHGSFPFSRVEPHQVDGLADVLAHGGFAWLLVNMRRVPNGTAKGKTQNQAWAFNWARWHFLKAACTWKNGNLRGTVIREQFDDPAWFTPIPRLRVEYQGEHEPIWDLRVLL